MKLMLLTIVLMTVSVTEVLAKKTDKKSEMRQDMQEAGRDTKRGASKAMRGLKDETCELVHGKMECGAKKIKHSLQNGSDKVEDAVE